MSTLIFTASPGRLLSLLRQNGSMTRNELLAATGMSRSTLYGRLEQLQELGLIYTSGRRHPEGGRPASVLSFDDRRKTVLCIDVGHHRATVSLCGLDGRVYRERFVNRPNTDGIAEIINHLSNLGADLVQEYGGDSPIGVGVAIPAPIDTHTGIRMQTIALPDSTFPISEKLYDRFGVPVVLENDARALAQGAVLEAPRMDSDGVLLGVKFSTGIGLGIVAGDSVMRGTTGAAGDLGHFQVTPGNGPVCTCGRRGCLAAYASGRAIIGNLDRTDIRDTNDLARFYDSGDEEVRVAVHQAARLLGRHLAGFVQVTNPQYVVFGGFLGGRPSIAEQVVPVVEEQLTAAIRSATHYKVVSSDSVTAHGLVDLVARKVFSPEAIDAKIFTSGSVVSASFRGHPSR